MNGIVKNYYYTTITTMLYKDLYINHDIRGNYIVHKHCDDRRLWQSSPLYIKYNRSLIQNFSLFFFFKPTISFIAMLFLFWVWLDSLKKSFSFKSSILFIYLGLFQFFLVCVRVCISECMCVCVFDFVALPIIPHLQTTN